MFSMEEKSEEKPFGKKEAMLKVLKQLIMLMRKKAGEGEMKVEIEQEGQEPEGEESSMQVGDAAPDSMKKMIQEAAGGEQESSVDPEELKSFFAKDDSKRPTAKHGMRVSGMMGKMQVQAKPMGKMKK